MTLSICVGFSRKAFDTPVSGSPERPALGCNRCTIALTVHAPSPSPLRQISCLTPSIDLTQLAAPNGCSDKVCGMNKCPDTFSTAS